MLIPKLIFSRSLFLFFVGLLNVALPTVFISRVSPIMVFYPVTENIVLESFVGNFFIVGKIKIGNENRIFSNVIDKVQPFFVNMSFKTHKIVQNQLNQSLLLLSAHSN